MNTPVILQQLQQASPMPPNLQAIKQMAGMVRSANNPQALLQSMAQNNPQLKQVLDVVQQAGNDPQKAFYAACEQRGVNPQTIIEMLK